MLLLSCFLWFADPYRIGESQMKRVIENVLTEPRFSDSYWGISIYAPLRHRFLYQKNPRKNLRPASNLKILTTLLALEYLGPDYVFETDLSGRGTIRNGVLEGDLIIGGSGDPSLSGNYQNYETADLLSVFIAALKDRGIGEIRGDLIADLSFFGEERLHPSWEWSDVGRLYGTPVTALSLNDGTTEMSLFYNGAGDFSYGLKPSGTPSPEFDFRLTREPAELDISYNRVWGRNAMVISGNLPPCREHRLRFSAWDPPLQFLNVFRNMLLNAGITLTGQCRTKTQADSEPKTLLAVLRSQPLGELAVILMRESQNHYADCFFKTTAKTIGGNADFKSGARVAAGFLQRVLRDQDIPAKQAAFAEFTPNGLGLRSQDKRRRFPKGKKTPAPAGLGFSMRDGSGLSAQNYLQPAQIVALLRYGINQNYWATWLTSFPTMGVSGTLEKRRGEKGIAQNRVWAKTGYIYRTRNLSGYAETLDGEPLIFSIMTNNYGCDTASVERAQDRICELLVQLKPNRNVKKKTRHLFKWSDHLRPSENLQEKALSR